jgi:hypothetical protein
MEQAKLYGKYDRPSGCVKKIYEELVLRSGVTIYNLPGCLIYNPRTSQSTAVQLSTEKQKLFFQFGRVVTDLVLPQFLQLWCASKQQA